MSTSPDPLDYATGPCRRPPGRWRRAGRRLLRQVGTVLLVAVPLAVAYGSYRWPWVWYGSRAAYQRHLIRTFTMSPDHVVYEEDPLRSARLLARPPDPRVSRLDDRQWSANTPNEYVSDGTSAAYSPPFYRAFYGNSSSPNTLVFLHERTGPTGRKRIVRAIRGSVYAGDHPRAGVFLKAGSIATDQLPNGPQLGTSGPSIHIPLRPELRMRLYAGQPDPVDTARFTIRYEINDIPGTIEGRLEADDTVTLRIRDGPAAARPDNSR